MRLIWGVGAAGQKALADAGIATFSDLLRWDHADLVARFGAMGDRLWHLARGEDGRSVSSRTPIKSISHETTFHEDTSDPALLDGHLWRLAEKVSDRAKARGLAGRVAVLKVKRADHRIVTRRQVLGDPTQLATTLHSRAAEMLRTVLEKAPFRLIGVGLSDLCDGADADRMPDMLDAGAARRAEVERASDAIRTRFGKDAILKGRALR